MGPAVAALIVFVIMGVLLGAMYWYYAIRKEETPQIKYSISGDVVTLSPGFSGMVNILVVPRIESTALITIGTVAAQFTIADGSVNTGVTVNTPGTYDVYVFDQNMQKVLGTTSFTIDFVRTPGPAFQPQQQAPAPGPVFQPQQQAPAPGPVFQPQQQAPAPGPRSV